MRVDKSKCNENGHIDLVVEYIRKKFNLYLDCSKGDCSVSLAKGPSLTVTAHSSVIGRVATR